MNEKARRLVIVRVAWLLALGLGAGIVVGSCADGSSPTGIAHLSASRPSPPGPAATITVTPSVDTLLPGDTLRLVAVVADANGQTIKDAAVVWSSTDILAASVDATGFVTAKSAGTAIVSAKVDGVEANARIKVASIASVVRFLDESPRVRAAMVWHGSDNSPKPYDEWPQAMKRKLVLAIDQLSDDGTGLPDVMVNRAGDLLQDSDYAETVLSTEDAENLYVANVGAFPSAGDGRPPSLVVR